ncbi:MAG TPA: reverse transcriptase domain-containing protein, partial [Steroidobacteraceae bacterium]
MTTPRYLTGYAAGSQVRGIALSPGDCAWNVNFNNGNANWNNQDNNGFVRAVRPGECQKSVSLHSLHTAWRAARRGKKPSANQLAFDTRWADGLLDLQRRLIAGTWLPGPCTCFVAKSPKAREIHAPDFADRVVHHWLVPQLETIYEPIFIHDAFSNRKGKGTHAAVERLRGFVRQVQSGQGGGWYLQLDIRNFFNSIHRPTLYRLLKERMNRHGVRLPVRRAVHALLRRSPAAGDVFYRCTAAERASVPDHKRLENAAPGCGIAIGNLSSQFFANVYLNELDQFVKHELRAQRYVRYVDDFVLVHESRAQLMAWREEITRFLRDRLRLCLKPEQRLEQLTSGIDFLGYVIFPRYSLVRRRVVIHAREKISAWRKRCSDRKPTSEQIQELRSVCASYAGHFSHANSYRLRQQF